MYQVDLADYLIAEQLQRNDPELRRHFAERVNERLDKMMIEGGLTEHEAEKVLESSRFLRDLERSIMQC